MGNIGEPGELEEVEIERSPDPATAPVREPAVAPAAVPEPEVVPA